jgi:hypothetical protein
MPAKKSTTKSKGKAVTPHKARADQIAANRQQIDEAGVIEALVTYATGGQLPIRDELGNVVGFTEPLDNQQRLQVLTHLSNKILPHLNASQVDVGTGDGGGIQLVFAQGVAPPRAGEPRDVTPEQNTIEHKQTIDDTETACTGQQQWRR